MEALTWIFPWEMSVKVNHAFFRKQILGVATYLGHLWNHILRIGMVLLSGS